MTKIVIIGSGNVASHLFTALRDIDDLDIVQCYNRRGLALSTEENAIHLVVSDIKQLTDANLFIMAISDDAIAEVSSEIPEGDHLVVHTSGSVSINSINNKHRKGVFYPLQSISKDKDVDFTKVPFCLEAEHIEDLNLIKRIAFSLSPKVYEISSEQRKILHVAAVFANNFSNYMFTIAKEECDQYNIPFEILHPLIIETAEKALTLPPEKSQTGPAIRNDLKTIERHLNQIADAEHKKVYKVITEAIQNKYGKKL